MTTGYTADAIAVAEQQITNTLTSARHDEPEFGHSVGGGKWAAHALQAGLTRSRDDNE